MTKSFIKENSKILFIRTDKGNVTIAIDQDEYKQKMRKMLGNISTYTVINRDPIRKLTESEN